MPTASFPTGDFKSVTVVSPHLDDAAFSLAGLLRRIAGAGGHVRVVNVFSRAAWAFGGPCDEGVATAVRRQEDVRALASLGVSERIDLGYPEALLREDPPFLSGPFPKGWRQLANQIARSVLDVALPDGPILAPCGFGGHIDHLLTRFGSVSIRRFRDVLYYPELPYAHRSRRAGGALRFLRDKARLELGIEREELRAHLAAAAAYQSQAEARHVQEMRSYFQTNSYSLWRP